MRGSEIRSDGLFSYVDLEARISAKHPLRAIRAIVDEMTSKVENMRNEGRMPQSRAISILISAMIPGLQPTKNSYFRSLLDRVPV